MIHLDIHMEKIHSNDWVKLPIDDEVFKKVEELEKL